MRNYSITTREGMEIEIRYPIEKQKPQYAQLWVNGVRLGEWIYGKVKKYESPEKWASEAVAKRNIVLDRNIKRLERELAAFKREKEIINQ